VQLSSELQEAKQGTTKPRKLSRDDEERKSHDSDSLGSFQLGSLRSVATLAVAGLEELETTADGADVIAVHKVLLESSRVPDVASAPQPQDAQSGTPWLQSASQPSPLLAVVPGPESKGLERMERARNAWRTHTVSPNAASSKVVAKDTTHSQGKGQAKADLFDKIDTNGDGKIDRREWAARHLASIDDEATAYLEQVSWKHGQDSVTEGALVESELAKNMRGQLQSLLESVQSNTRRSTK